MFIESRSQNQPSSVRSEMFKCGQNISLPGELVELKWGSVYAPSRAPNRILLFPFLQRIQHDVGCSFRSATLA